ncbi:MAG: amino acid permease [Pseudomonadota bacterium]
MNTVVHAPELKRALTLPLVVLYGVGVTVGAGIYVLIGLTAGKAGVHAPVSFVFAAIVVAFSAASFAELAGRLPLSAGEVAYVRAGFRSPGASLVVGLMVVLSATVSSAAISVGAAGYILEFLSLPEAMITAAVVVFMAAIAAYGIMESVTFAGLCTVIEVLGLLTIVAAGLYFDPRLPLRFGEVLPDLAGAGAWHGVLGATLLAFFAFVGFEDIVNLAEEVREPKRTLPWAIFLTLGVSTLIYVLVVSVSVLSVSTSELSASRAPLGLVFNRISGYPPDAISSIAIVATLNGVIVQIIMASRVLYGLGKQGAVPAVFGRVSRTTRTPVFATFTVAGAILLLALFVPLQSLAEMTSRVVLVIFMIVNAALVALKLRGEPAPADAFTVGVWVPVLGSVVCAAALASDFLLS